MSAGSFKFKEQKVCQNESLTAFEVRGLVQATWGLCIISAFIHHQACRPQLRFSEVLALFLSDTRYSFAQVICQAVSVDSQSQSGGQSYACREA